MSIPEFLSSAWDWKPSVVLGCCALVAGYAWIVGLRFSRRTASWLASVFLIAFALLSPIDELADTYLFSVHMAKHIAFVLIVPALLLMGLPAAPVARLLRYRFVARAQAFFGSPAVAWCIGLGAMAFWHIPTFFNAALAHEPLHIAEHISLLAAGAIYWWPILSPFPELRMQPVPHAAGYLFSSCLACTTIGILITFAPAPLYPAYTAPHDVYGILPAIRTEWGISASLDQQIGGLLMWVPGCLIYLTAIMAMFARWYAEESLKATQEA